MTWMYNGKAYGEHDPSEYPGDVSTRMDVVSDMLCDQDVDVEFERWLDDEFAPHDIYGMICDAMKGSKVTETVYAELWGDYIEDMAEDVGFLGDHGAVWKEESE